MARKKPEPKNRATATKVEPWEKDRVIRWLALTDNQSEAARQTGISVSTAHEIYHANQDEIIRLRAEMKVELGNQFDATIQAVQEKIREVTAWITNVQSAKDLAGPLFDLSKTVAIQTERRQVIAGVPGTIGEVRGDKPGEAIGAELAKQLKQDREYLKKVGVMLKEETEVSTE